MRSYLRATVKPPLNTGMSLPSPVAALDTEVSGVNLGGKDLGCFMKSTWLFLDRIFLTV